MTRVGAIALNTFDLSEADALAACAAATRETGLPCTDPVRFDPSVLVDAVAAAREVYLKTRSRQPSAVS